jgi:hypothetical protein
MMAEPSQIVSTPDAAAERFYSGALNRIRHFMAGLAPLLVAVGWWRFGIRSAVGFAFGCAIAYINFYWLKRVISGFADRATGADHTRSEQGSEQRIVPRFLVRYLLMAVGAYVIFTVSPASLNGLLAGLFLPVAAIVCEAVYELYAALSRGI